MEYCRYVPLVVEVTFKSIRPSAFHGVDTIIQEQSETVMLEDAFRVDVFLRNIQVIDQDNWGNMTEKDNHIGIQRSPNILSAQTHIY
jgi:hypothetical protein